MSPEYSGVPASSEPPTASSNLMESSPKTTNTVLVLAAVEIFLGLLSLVCAAVLLDEDFVLGFIGFVPALVVGTLVSLMCSR